MSGIDDVISAFDVYRYKYFKIPLVTKWLIDELRYRDGYVRVSFDLGNTFTTINVSGGVIDIDGFSYYLDFLAEVLRSERVYILRNGKYGDVAFFRDGTYYKLYPIAMYGAPTIEISGIKMHRIVGTTPWEDASKKIHGLGVEKGSKVLDICTGLGYTAIHSLYRGGKVVTIEKDRNVLDIAKYNPWSQKLGDIPILLGDAYVLLDDLPRGFFDIVVHDPPRMARAGELYSLDFYKKIYKVLNNRGRLYHYVGNPGYKGGKDIIKGVARRLKSAGFRVRIVRDMMSIYAFKI
ncbi:TPA: SAM-dependent methyltransferase [Candidatus Geothermarchaeota archaeon]|nr:SAM-dependent methyltransferase [Candidatus Geothermarchaeota archaeon]HIQ13259.1 SAM-dependent methyltransferase [Thermoprotei archaeon]